MNVLINNQNVNEQIALGEMLPTEVALFCAEWKQRLDELVAADISLDIIRKVYGYEIKCRYTNGEVRWYFQLELYYPNEPFEPSIMYMKINRFMTLPTRQGNGRRAFEALLACCKHLSKLEEIRLRAIRHAVIFWRKQGFVEFFEQEDLGDIKLPKPVARCNFVYQVKQDRLLCFS